MKEMKRFCPRCGSIDIIPSKQIIDNVIADFKFFECSACNWRGVPLEGTIDFINEFKEKLARKGEHSTRKEIVAIFNDDGEKIGETTVSECHVKGFWHKISALMLFNSNGELLIQKRSSLVPSPNLLDFSAAGHIVLGKTPLETIKKEAFEELGIELNEKKIELLGEVKCCYFDDLGKVKHHYFVFKTIFNGSFKPNFEVAWVKFFSIKEIERMLNENLKQFTDGFVLSFKKFVLGDKIG
jgi:isopentenyl-diphosphate delta-isomerase